MPEEKISPQITPEPGLEPKPIVEPVSKPEKPEVPPKPASNRLKIILLSVLGLVLVGGLVFAAYRFTQKRTQPGLQPIPTPLPSEVSTKEGDPTASWKTYTNIKYRYSMKYPNNVTYQESDFLLEGRTETKVIFQIDGGSLEIAANVGGRGAAPIKTQNITIGGVKTDKYYETETTGAIKAILSPKGDELYFSFFLSEDPVKSKEIDTLIDQILSTFKFFPSEGLEIPTPTPTLSPRKVLYRNIPGWPLYGALLDFNFQYPPDYITPQKNIVDFMNRDEFYCSFSTNKKVGAGLDTLNFIVTPKTQEERIGRALKILNYSGYLKKEEIELSSHPAVLLDLDQYYKHFLSDRALVVETDSMLMIVHYQQNETNQNWNYILESIRFGINFNKGYFETKLNECRS